MAIESINFTMASSLKLSHFCSLFFCIKAKLAWPMSWDGTVLVCNPLEMKLFSMAGGKYGIQAFALFLLQITWAVLSSTRVH